MALQSWVPPQECSHGKGALQRSWLDYLHGAKIWRDHLATSKGMQKRHNLILIALARTSKGIIYSSFIVHLGVSENSVPLNPMVLLIIIPFKWLFHWEYTQHFQTKPFIIILPIPVHPRRHSLASSQKFRSPQSKPLAACTGNHKISQSPSDADIGNLNLLGNSFQNKNWCPTDVQLISFVSVASMVNGAHFLNGASCSHNHHMTTGCW